MIEESMTMDGDKQALGRFKMYISEAEDSTMLLAKIKHVEGVIEAEFV
jgi:hypothetical protein